MRLGILRSWPGWELRFEIFLSAALLCTDLGFAQSTPATPGAPSQQDSASKTDKAENADKADKADKKDDKSSEPAMTKLRIRVLNDQNKPVVNASVYVRFYTAGGLMHHE